MMDRYFWRDVFERARRPLTWLALVVLGLCIAALIRTL